MRHTIGLTAAALVLTACGGGTSVNESTPTPTPTPGAAVAAMFRAAYEVCEIDKAGRVQYAEFGDGGMTLTLDGGMPLSRTICVLEALDMPDSVNSHIGQTRALDGMQEDAWGDIAARWTYHPDDGLSITLTAAR